MANGEIDCGSVVRELFTFLDGELTEARRTVITRHLHHCPDCHEVVEFHAELKITVARKCREAVPDGLRERVLGALHGEYGGLGFGR